MSEANDAGIELDANETQIFTAAISDEALEAAGCAWTGQGIAFTVAFCTGGTDCPF